MTGWKIIIAALGLCLLIEGLFYFALPDVAQRVMAAILRKGTSMVRKAGMFGIISGLLVLWIASML